MTPPPMTGELLRGSGGSDSGTARRFAVCVENSVPVASGAMARSGLGKGLGALIGTPAVATPRDGSDAGERVHQIELTTHCPEHIAAAEGFCARCAAGTNRVDSAARHYSASDRPPGGHAI